MRCIISTVGQSVFSNAEPHLRERFREFGRQENIEITDILKKTKGFPGEDLYRLRLDTLLAQASDSTSLRRSSAELNSLLSIIQHQEFQDGHAFHFLATSTPDGALAARVLRDFCREYFNHSGVEVKVIAGLQVQDVQAFLKTGLPSLIEAIYDIVDGAKNYVPLFNPTGGFKAVIPYFTLVGMLKGVEMAYLYEFSDELVTLSALPIDFNVASIAPYYEALAACAVEGLSSSQLQKSLGLNGQPVEDHPLWSLFMKVDNNYMVSGLGEIIFRTLQEQRSRQPVYIARELWESYQTSDANTQQLYRSWFDQMRSEGWRQNQLHATLHKAKVAKPAGDDRLFYFEEPDGAILVAEITRHSNQSYERMSADFKQGRHTRKDYERWHYWGS